MDEEIVQQNEDKTQKPIVDTDAFLDLNFVPQWARRPPDAVHAKRYRDPDSHGGKSAHRPHHRSAGKRDRRERDTHDRKERRKPHTPHHESRPSSDFNPPPVRSLVRRLVHSSPSGEGGSSQSEGGSLGEGGTSDHRSLQAHFLPERKAIAEMAKRVAATHKAYPLLDLAALLLGREGLCYVRLECSANAPAETALYQCQRCRTVALERSTIETHVIQDHLEDFFEAQTETLDPPTGVFTCVAFCGMSNQPLGPPNHHSYQEAVKQIHAQQFSHIPLETYRSKIRMSHDPEDVEKWKASCTTRTVYTRKDSDATPLQLREAQRFMEAEVVSKSIKSTRRVILQESEAHAIHDPAIRAVLHHAWQRELRFPIHTALALRAALRSRHLHVFKAGPGKGMHFVTAVHPSPLNPDAAIPAIRDTLQYLQKHPGCTRQEVVHDLLGDVSHEDPQAKELLQPISWLTERGHIIEFFNGRLAVPR